MPITLYRGISVCLDRDTYLRISMERSYIHQATCAVSDYGCHGLSLRPPGRPSSLTHRPHHGNGARGAQPESRPPGFC